MANVAVVIPAYKAKLTAMEEISLMQVRRVLSRYPQIFFSPEKFSYNGDTITFARQYFDSIQSYCRLMMSPQFYEAFSAYDYILIYQLDAFVFYDALEEFCNLGYDYIGAPWPRYSWSGDRKPRTPQVGNGGFSLRKVASFHRLLKTFETLPNWSVFLEYTEDAFFAWCALQGLDFTAAPIPIAELFSMEHIPARHVRKIKGVPFGCHNWQKFSADFYIKLMAQFGYDLRPFKNQLGSEDTERYTPNELANLTMNRLVRRAKRGLSVSHYLPTKKFASIRVLRDSDTMQILPHLATLADNVFIYDDWRTLAAEVPAADKPHLILTLLDDSPLIELIEGHGLIYGRHIISYQREVLRWYERFFHNLGK